MCRCRWPWSSRRTLENSASAELAWRALRRVVSVIPILGIFLPTLGIFKPPTFTPRWLPASGTLLTAPLPLLKSDKAPEKAALPLFEALLALPTGGADPYAALLFVGPTTTDIVRTVGGDLPNSSETAGQRIGYRARPHSEQREESALGCERRTCRSLAPSGRGVQGERLSTARTASEIGEEPKEKRPARRQAVDLFNCGGARPVHATQYGQGPTSLLVVRLGDRAVRRPRTAR
jgi:hypothetical protein